MKVVNAASRQAKQGVKAESHARLKKTAISRQARTEVTITTDSVTANNAIIIQTYISYSSIAWLHFSYGTLLLSCSKQHKQYEVCYYTVCVCMLIINIQILSTQSTVELYVCTHVVCKYACVDACNICMYYSIY